MKKINPSMMKKSDTPGAIPEQIRNGKGRKTHIEATGPIPFNVRAEPAAKQLFSIIAAEEGRTQQDILAEALNDFFQKYGKPRLA